MASAAQLKARAAFTKMVKERARLRAAGKLPPMQRKTKAAKVKHKAGKPSPAQLAARKKFVAMVRAKAAAKKKTNSRGFSTEPPSWTKNPKKKKPATRKNFLGLSYSGPGKKRTKKIGHTGKRGSGFLSVSARTKWGMKRKTKRATKKLGKLFNPAILRLTEAQAKAYGGKIKGLGAPTQTTRTRSVSSAPRRKATKKFKKVGVFGGSGFLGLGRSIQRIKA